MESTNVTVIVPMNPLPWWITSKIANWRFVVSIGNLADTEPQDLTIMDWKILFEVALRQSGAIWRICPPIVLPNTPWPSDPVIVPAVGNGNGAINVSNSNASNGTQPSKSLKGKERQVDTHTEISITCRICSVDFVQGLAIFRLDQATITALANHHARYISHVQQSGRITAEEAARLMREFRLQMASLQLTLNAAVLAATDGVFARGDFPAFARRPTAFPFIVNQMALALSDMGLRKIIRDEFVILESRTQPVQLAPRPPVETVQAAGQGIRRPDEESHRQEVPANAVTTPLPHQQVYPLEATKGQDPPVKGKASGERESIPGTPEVLKTSEHLVKVSRDRKWVLNRRHFNSLAPILIKNMKEWAQADREKKEALLAESGESLAVVPSATEKGKSYRGANIVENERGGKGRRPSHQYPATTRPSSSSSPSTLTSPPPSSFDQTITAPSTSPIAMSPPTTAASLPSPRSPRSPPSNDIGNVAPTTSSASPKAAGPKRARDAGLEGQLDNDERSIFNMDSSFMPVTRSQAAIVRGPPKVASKAVAKSKAPRKGRIAAAIPPAPRMSRARKVVAINDDDEDEEEEEEDDVEDDDDNEDFIPAGRRASTPQAPTRTTSKKRPARALSPPPPAKRRMAPAKKIVVVSDDESGDDDDEDNDDIDNDDFVPVVRHPYAPRTTRSSRSKTTTTTTKKAATATKKAPATTRKAPTTRAPKPPPMGEKVVESAPQPPRGLLKRKRYEDPAEESGPEDCDLDSDTPDTEMLCDSEDDADHRSRKLRRRERKKLRREGQPIPPYLLQTYPALTPQQHRENEQKLKKAEEKHEEAEEKHEGEREEAFEHSLKTRTFPTVYVNQLPECEACGKRHVQYYQSATHVFKVALKKQPKPANKPDDKGKGPQTDVPDDESDGTDTEDLDYVGPGCPRQFRPYDL
ncbi:hypothetical protein ABW21_db0205752 [Orbilia brochopaga]|nr:hypothetical protein ABW21_db0205752 [Drechslerella brochopaga]